MSYIAAKKRWETSFAAIILPANSLAYLSYNKLFHASELAVSPHYFKNYFAGEKKNKFI